jgi:serine/alanine adding enzyme
MQYITDYRKIDHVAWNQYVENHQDGNVFHTPEMFDVYLHSKGYQPILIAMVDDDYQIRALMISVILSESKKIYNSLTTRSILFGHPLISENNDDVIPNLWDFYDKIIKRKAIYTQIRNFDFNHFNHKKLLETRNYIYEDHLNIILSLKDGKDSVWEKFSRSRKKGIKKALNANFSFEACESSVKIDIFYNLLSISYKRIKLPFPEIDHFQRITEFAKNYYKVFYVKQDDEVVAALFALKHKNVMYGYYMGSIDNEDIIRLKPIDLLFWEVFKWCVDNNIEYFDWMGAGKPDKDYGVRDFKLQFGGETSNLGRYEKQHKPLIFKIAKIGFALYKKFK